MTPKYLGFLGFVQLITNISDGRLWSG